MSTFLASDTWFTLRSPLNWFNCIPLVVMALTIRALFFGCYVQHGERYRQPDTPDYHVSAYALALNKGMFNVVTREPIFWRTPGYPLYLSIFYRIFGINTFDFSANGPAQRASIWLQIIACSFLPLLIWLFAFILLNNYYVAWLCAWISTIQPGFILSSCFLLSDALALLPLFFALWLFFSTVHIGKLTGSSHKSFSIVRLVLSALFLGVYTWIRPNGQFTVFLLLITFLFSSFSWASKLKKMLLFFLVFSATIAPWYVRNYMLTDHWFYCPMSGPYLQTFLTPKILRRLTNKPLEQCINALLRPAHQEWLLQRDSARKQIPPRFVSRELVCSKYAWPLIYQHPWWFLSDWITEVCKTTFDLYSHQLITFTNGSFIADPVEEFLDIKWKECLYCLPAPFWMRFICWLEAFWTFFLWLGILGGFLFFIVLPAVKGKSNSFTWNWIVCAFFFGGIVWMTGGFGYARLRLPAEPFLMIASLNFWYHFLLYISQRKMYWSYLRVNASKPQTSM